ncbi:helix-turn-helix domain-containing protein [Paenibacillus xylanilyticus]|uniref:helix-turn-helix domain-containing protein n=1 Tax=Paenibacillus xylanilyticus TaxID=248903 RepID=UPI0039A20FEE
MSLTIEQILPKPWLCSLHHIQYVQYPPSEPSISVNYTTSSNHSLFIITQGEGELMAQDVMFKLSKGMILFVPAGVSIFPLQNKTFSETKLHYYKLDLVLGEESKDASNAQLNKKKPALQQRKGIFEPSMLIELSYNPWSSCLEVLDQMLRQQETSDWLEQWNIQLRFQEWFRVLLQQNDPRNTCQDHRSLLQRSIRYIRDHYNHPITVDELAADTRLTRSSYTRQFKEMTGKLPLDYVNTIRLERSKQLLQLTDDRLHDIAQNVGFSNEYYFSRRFKQYAGISPGVYRRHYRQDVRVFAPYLEDFVLALGVEPVLQYSHHSWGKQHYLGMDDVPEFDVSHQDAMFQESHKPDFIMLNDGCKRWNLDRFEQVAPTFYVHHRGEDWRSILRSTADVLGKGDRVRDVVGTYEEKAREAKELLTRSTQGKTVAFLRISATEIVLYGAQQGYVGPVMYGDLGLTPHPLVQQWTKGERRIDIQLEQLAQLHADHLFITFDNVDSVIPGEERKLLDTTEWKQLPAVKSGHVYEVDFLSWMNYGVISHGKKIDDILRFMA